MEYRQGMGLGGKIEILCWMRLAEAESLMKRLKPKEQQKEAGSLHGSSGGEHLNVQTILQIML